MDPSNGTGSCEFSIGGPKLWLGLAAGIGTGLCSIPAGEWVFSFAGYRISPGREAAHESALFLFLVVGTGAWFLFAWLLLGRRYRLDPDFWVSGDAMISAFIGSASIYVFRAISATMVQRNEDSFPAFNQLVGFIGCLALVYLLIGVFFSVRQPRNGLFFAGLCAVSVLELSDYESVFPSGYAIYLTGIRMAFVFAYVYGGPYSQRIVASLISAYFITLAVLDAFAVVDFDVGAVVTFGIVYIPSLLGCGVGSLISRRKLHSHERLQEIEKPSRVREDVERAGDERD